MRKSEGMEGEKKEGERGCGRGGEEEEVEGGGWRGKERKGIIYVMLNCTCSSVKCPQYFLVFLTYDTP